MGLKPWHFMEPSHCAVGTGAGVPIRTDTMDWEVELAAVIGRTARNVSVADALNYVAGYTVANDLSARGLTAPAPSRAKLTFQVRLDWAEGVRAPARWGPGLFRLATFQTRRILRLKLTVNGQLRQDSSTSMMIFSMRNRSPISRAVWSFVLAMSS